MNYRLVQKSYSKLKYDLHKQFILATQTPHLLFNLNLVAQIINPILHQALITELTEFTSIQSTAKHLFEQTQKTAKQEFLRQQEAEKVLRIKDHSDRKTMILCKLNIKVQAESKLVFFDCFNRP